MTETLKKATTAALTVIADPRVAVACNVVIGLAVIALTTQRRMMIMR